jgi:hypothetical protein
MTSVRITGSCLCNRVCFELTAAPVWAHNCHCSRQASLVQHHRFAAAASRRPRLRRGRIEPVASHVRDSGLRVVRFTSM